MSFVGRNNIKDEPEWEDYCISEAQTREAVRGVKHEPGSEPLGSFAGTTDTNYKTDGSIDSNHLVESNSIKSSDTKQNNNVSVTVKEESGAMSWQELTGWYEETNNTDKLKNPLDLYSGMAEKLETDAESEELNKAPAVFETPRVVNSRPDLIVINNIAQEINRKETIVQEKISRPVTKYVYTPNQQPVLPVNTNSQIKKPYACNKVTINPEIGLLSQPLKVTNALLKNNLVSVSESVKSQSSTYQTIPLLNSVAYNNPAIQRPMVPMPCPSRRATEFLRQRLPKGIFRPINVPISQLNDKVSLNPLEKNPLQTKTSIPKLRPVHISKLQSDTISKLQPGCISKFQSVTISKLQPGSISKLRPDTVSNLQSGKPSFIPLVSNPFDYVKSIYQKVPNANDIKKLSTTSALKSNIHQATPSSKPTPMIPTNFQRITITKPINSQLPEGVENSLTAKIINGTQSVTQNNSNMQRIATLAPRIFPKLVNSQIAKRIHSHILQNENGYRKAEVTQTCKIQQIAPKSIPKASGPVNSPNSIDIDIIPGSNINDDRQVVTQNLQPNSNTDSKSTDKVINLEDFLKPSYVVLERMKERNCKMCEKKFYEYKALVDHMKKRLKWKQPVSHLGNDGGIIKDTTKTDSLQPSLACKYCKKLFSKYTSLSQHVRRNHLCRMRNFHCDYCGKKCLERRHLVNHIRTHTGEKPYKCLICKTRHRTASNLASHNINMHGTKKGKKYFCPICDRPFQVSSNMKKHLRTHSGERRYVCEMCKKRFLEKHHLTRHMESHLGIRRYPCNICKMRFTRKAHLDRHEKNIHKKKLKTSRQNRKSNCQ